MVKTRAYINIALVKYWGKSDTYFNLSNQPSLSYTIKDFYTDVSATINDKDLLLINGLIANDIEQEKINKWLNKVRKIYGFKEYIKFDNYNNVPFKAGLASSASSYAAMALAITRLVNLDVSKEDVSKIARLGSGSASRSIYGGFVEWKYGKTHDESYSEKLKVNWEEFNMFVIILDSKEKKISSREAMLKTKELKEYDDFVEKSFADFNNMKVAIKERNIEKVGTIAEENAKRMHDIINKTGINYFNKDTYKIINEVENLRKKGVEVYYTIDAGANVKLISINKYRNEILKAFNNYNITSVKQGEDSYFRD